MARFEQGGNVHSRREFVVNACKVGSVLALHGSVAQFFVACKSDDNPNAPALPVVQGTLAGGTVTVSIPAGSALAVVGNAALVQFSGGALLVAHVSQDSFVALTATCTHEACTITGFQEQTYVCPCHGSRFRTNGQVAQGPASSALRTYQTQFANEELTIFL
ncbi:MAG: Rieske (2Fe-2S) protein [Bacteroidetes bacterium]|nr:Rieske (2Fe-2S) protein [Bacteroidota bacterium]MCW5896312.1 Rieske (2Fe-2S) protein [Bacteroidota bacterium]